MGVPHRWPAITLLVACSALVQGVIIARSSVPALDSLRSVAAAEAFLRAPNLATLTEEPEAPLFPVWLAAVHRTREALLTTSPRWDASVQLAAAIPLVLWPVPIYWLTRRRCGSRAGMLAGLLACLLPTAAQLGGEGLPDSLYLLLFATAYVLLAHESTSQARAIAAGILVGLAMLVRVEAVLLIVIVPLVQRWSISRSWRNAIVPALGVAVAIVPWLAATGSLAPNAAIARLAARSPARDGWVFNAFNAVSMSQAVATDIDSGSAFDTKERGQSTRRYGLLASVVETADELLIATGFVLIPPATFGFLRVRRWRTGDRMALLGAGAWIAIGFANALATGYLSSRHLLPVAVFLLPAAACGLNASLQFRATLPRLRYGLMATVMLAWGAWCLRPLHADRAGHRAVGEWLAENASQSEFVLDTWGWSALSSGRATYRYDAAREAFSDARLRYIVVEQRELQTGSPRADTLCDLLARHGSRVAEFASEGGQSPVLIFHWRPPLAQNDAANHKLGCLGSNVLVRPQNHASRGE